MTTMTIPTITLIPSAPSDVTSFNDTEPDTDDSDDLFTRFYASCSYFSHIHGLTCDDIDCDNHTITVKDIAGPNATALDVICNGCFFFPLAATMTTVTISDGSL